jgi:hypothetical protein
VLLRAMIAARARHVHVRQSYLAAGRPLSVVNQGIVGNRHQQH